MTVTQVLMGPGSWSLQLRDDTPPSVRTQIQKLDHVVICRRKIDAGLLYTDASALAAVKAQGGYIGVILDTQGRTGLSGQDPYWWIARKRLTSQITLTSTNTSTWLDQIFPANGITKGSVTNGTSFAGVVDIGRMVGETLGWICENAGVEWRLRPDFSVDVAPSTTLFPAATTTSAAVITRNAAGDEGGLSGILADAVELETDATDIASDVTVVHSATDKKVKLVTATTTPTGVRWVAPDGTTPAITVVGTAKSLKPAEASTYATNLVARLSVLNRTVRLSSDSHNVTGDVAPGTRVWVYDRDADLYDTSNQVPWRGEVISPVQLRVASITWPVVAGMAVYARLNGGATWLDLSDYVVSEPDTVTWDVNFTGKRRNQAPVALGYVSLNMAGGGGGGQGGRPAHGDALAESETDADAGGWTPTWTNAAKGTGGSAANAGAYTIAKGQMRVQAEIVLGTGGGAGVTGAVSVAMPSGWQADCVSSRRHIVGTARVVAAGNEYAGFVEVDGGTPGSLQVRCLDVATGQTQALSATVPATFAAGDVIDIDVIIAVERT